MNSYLDIPILEIIYKCNLKFKSSTLGCNEIQVSCPFCCPDHNYHLYCNSLNNKFHCARCGGSGTNSVSLYAQINNMSFQDAYKELTQGGAGKELVFKPLHKPQKNQAHAMRSIADRHKIYTHFLVMLTLREGHMKDLLSRGLALGQIHQNMYRSVPSKEEARAVCLALSKLYDLEGIPGFFINEDNWTCLTSQGYLIPYRNYKGLIQGMQIRKDDAKEKKFIRFSTSNLPNGSKADCFIHVTGNRQAKTALILEGALKCDIIEPFYPDYLFLGLQGISSIKLLPHTLHELKVVEVIDGIDMDRLTKPGAAKSHQRLMKVIQDFAYVPYRWNPVYNGLDDFCHSKSIIEKLNYLIS